MNRIESIVPSPQMTNAYSIRFVKSISIRSSLTRVTQSCLLAPGTTKISSYFTKHWTKFLTHQTGNYPVTCFVSKPSRITLVELSINTSYQKLPFGSGDYHTQISSYVTKHWTKFLNSSDRESIQNTSSTKDENCPFAGYRYKLLCNSETPLAKNFRQKKWISQVRITEYVSFDLFYT